MSIIYFITLWYSQYDTIDIYVPVSLTFNPRSCPGMHRTRQSAGIVFERVIPQSLAESTASPLDLGRCIHNQHFNYYQTDYRRLVFIDELVPSQLLW